MTGKEINIKLRPVEEQRDLLLEQNMLLTGKIATLEKENAELKAVERMALYSKMSDQLTKAKELLKQWLQTSKASGCDNINIVTDTEQFLKESE